MKYMYLVTLVVWGASLCLLIDSGSWVAIPFAVGCMVHSLDLFLRELAKI